jgi:hypothetical protein
MQKQSINTNYNPNTLKTSMKNTDVLFPAHSIHQEKDVSGKYKPNTTLRMKLIVP